MLDKKIIPETIPFDFDENYEFVRSVFESYGYDIEEGSNIQQQAIAMSYMVSMLNANTAVNINEMLLPLARKRKPLLLNARTLGYEIRHITSFVYRLTLSFGSGPHQISQYEKFTVNGKKYYYMGDNITTIEPNSTLQIDVVEGDLKLWKDDNSLKNMISVYTTEGGKTKGDYFVDVPFTNVENSGLRVFVQKPSQDLVEYPKIDNFIIDSDTIGEIGFIRLDDIDFKTPRVYFKMGSVGLDLPDNTQVFIDALISSGSNGKMEYSNFDDVKTTLACEVIGIDLVSNGSAEESLESVKINAPLFHNAANRIVTKRDINTFINRDTRVENCVVWDGNDEYPYRPGHVWFSGISSHTIRNLAPNAEKTKWELQNKNDLLNWYISDGDVQSIKKTIEPVSIPTLAYHHRHPIYMDFDYTVQVVRYSRSQTPKEWNEELFGVIDDYFAGIQSHDGAENFVFEYFQSNLDKRIDTSLTDATGFNISLQNSITITSKDILNETIEANGTEVIKDQVRFHLGTPFEKFVTFDLSGEPFVDSQYLPKLNSEINGKTLSVNFNTETKLNSNRGIAYPIRLNSTVIGSYIVLTGLEDTIEVIINTSGEIVSELDNGIKIGVQYNSPNFKVSRNTIPSLNTVEFINK